MASYQRPRVPDFAAQLRPEIVQLHSSEYRTPARLREGPVLIAGAGNSGAEIAMELARGRQVWLAGRDTGEVPFRIDSLAARLFLTRFVLQFVFHRVLTVRTPLGRKVRPKAISTGVTLIRGKSKDLAAAQVRRAPRVVGARDGWPLLEDGRVLEVATVIWSTGFHAGFSWISRRSSRSRRTGHQRRRRGTACRRESSRCCASSRRARRTR
jgi:putative flavoprotein involved in K+ transport